MSMKILLLAAGRSKRMKPIEDKNFLNFLGKPLIQHQLELLKSCGFKDIVVVGGKHNLEKIGKIGKVSIKEQKDLELGMCGAVLAAKDLIKNEPVLIVSSNDVVDASAFELIKKAMKSSEADGYLLAKKVKEYFPGGYLKTDKKGFIQAIVEKPAQGKEPSNLVNLVVHYHKNPAKLIAELSRTKSSKDDLYELALANLIKKGMKIKAVPYDGFWQPIKFPWHVQKVFYHLFSLAKKPKNNVILGKNVKIFDGAVVKGPAYIGDNSIIATNALVRESNIGANCVIGFSTEVARSFLGNDVWTHVNYIGDSVVGDNVSLGGGTKTGNFRLDEKNIGDTGTNKFGAVIGNNVRIGINTSLMPGVKIGEGSFVGAGIVIAQDIPEKTFVRGEFKLKISPNNVSVNVRKRLK